MLYLDEIFHMLNIFKAIAITTIKYSSLLIFTFTPISSFSEMHHKKNSVNGSGLKIPRIVSSKNSLAYIRTGPGKDFPIKYELKQKGHPLKIIAEFNNWRKISTENKLTGWVHTQLLSSTRTGLIIEKTSLKRKPSMSSKTKANLLEGLLLKIKKCNLQWCKVEIYKNKNFFGWVYKKNIWGSTSK